MLVYDVGACQGKKARQYIEAGAHVVCFEPNPVLARALAVRFTRQATIVEAALGPVNGAIPFWIADTASLSTCSRAWMTGRFAGHKWDRSMIVPMMTLDHARSVYGEPEFVKIDVEGFEYEVLKGMRVPVKALSIEFAREFLDQTRLCVDYLHRMGYEKFGWAQGKNTNVAHWVHPDALMRELETLPDLAWGDVYMRQ